MILVCLGVWIHKLNGLFPLILLEVGFFLTSVTYLAINIILKGPIAITPVIPIHYVYPSNGIYDIRVYVAATPPIQPSEINWLDNDLAQVNDRRRHLYQLLDFGTKLRILNMTTERFGTYYVSVTRDNMLHPVQRIMLMHNSKFMSNSNRAVSYCYST